MFFGFGFAGILLVWIGPGGQRILLEFGLYRTKQVGRESFIDWWSIGSGVGEVFPSHIGRSYL
jgi:hypothetical protein